MVSIIDKYHKELVDLCRKHYVKRLDVFGSVVTDNFSPSSDIDFLVELDSKINPQRFDNFFELHRALEKLLDRSLDLVEPGGSNNPYFIREITKTRRNIYA